MHHDYVWDGAHRDETQVKISNIIKKKTSFKFTVFQNSHVAAIIKYLCVVIFFLVAELFFLF